MKHYIFQCKWIVLSDTAKSTFGVSPKILRRNCNIFVRVYLTRPHNTTKFHTSTARGRVDVMGCELLVPDPETQRPGPGMETFIMANWPWFIFDVDPIWILGLECTPDGFWHHTAEPFGSSKNILPYDAENHEVNNVHPYCFRKPPPSSVCSHPRS